MSGFLRPGDRPALRSQTAALARGESSRSLAAHLAQRTDSRARVTLSEAYLPGESEPAVLVVMWPTSDHVWSPADGPAPATAASASVAAREATLTDLLDRTSGIVLRAEAEGPVTALGAAASAVREELADWAVLDLVQDGVLTRHVVSGSEETDAPGLEKEIAQQDPTACPVVVEVVGAASAVLDGLAEGGAFRPRQRGSVADGTSRCGLPAERRAHHGGRRTTRARRRHTSAHGGAAVVLPGRGQVCGEDRRAHGHRGRAERRAGLRTGPATGRDAASSGMRDS